MRLDISRESYNSASKKAVKYIEQFCQTIDDVPSRPDTRTNLSIDLLREPMPENPTELDDVIEIIESTILSNVALPSSPRFLSYIISSGNIPAAIAAFMYESVNVQNAKQSLSPAGTEIGRVATQWIAEFVGLGKEFYGQVTTGGSQANLLSLTIARNHIAPFDLVKKGVKSGPPLTIYTSSESHVSIRKSVDILGLGRNQLRVIPVNSDYRINTEELKNIIGRDIAKGFHPICVVAAGGSTNTGAVDDLIAIRKICDTHNIWMHVDAAYGGPAAGTTLVGNSFAGLNTADSISIDPHKWFYVPYECGAIFVKRSGLLFETFSSSPAYLSSSVEGSPERDLFECDFQMSRNLKELKLWTTFKTFGARKLRRAIEDNIMTVRYLENQLLSLPDFEVVSKASLSVLCFRYVGNIDRTRLSRETIDNLNLAILRRIDADKRFYLAGTILNGMQVIRVCIVNHRTTISHMDELLGLLRECGKDVGHELLRISPVRK